MRTLVTETGQRSEVSLDDVRERLRSGQTGFWLDIEQPGPDDYRFLLDDFSFHPLTVEDVQLQNQRPKLDLFPGYKFAVLFTVELDGDQLRFQEHHLYLSHRWLITIHHQPSAALDDVRERVAGTPDLTRGELGFLQYLAIDAIVDSLFPTLDKLDETIDEVEDRALVRAQADTLARISDLKHEVSELRRVVSPQRDVFQRLLAHSLDHASEELTLYWRDVYEQLVRQYEMVDSLRDLLTGTMEVYMSTVSNRLNATMKQLTVIASVFLPLTFFTGFFGMNFGYLVNHISSDTAFLLGMVVMVVAVSVQVYVFRRQGWI